jgi:hypothetical protein
VLKQFFEGGEADLPYPVRRESDEFDYGYALTVHKAQGSQWDDVMLFDESYAFGEHRNRWLYTGLTRAAATRFGDEPVAATRKLNDVGAAASPSVFSVHGAHHGRRTSAILGGGDQEQRRTLRVFECHPIANAQGCLKIDASGRRDDMPIIRRLHLECRQRVGEGRRKTLERHCQDARPAPPSQ